MNIFRHIHHIDLWRLQISWNTSMDYNVSFLNGINVYIYRLSIESRTEFIGSQIFFQGAKNYLIRASYEYVGRPDTAVF